MNEILFAAPAILFLLFGLLLFGRLLLKQQRDQIKKLLAVGNVGWNRDILRRQNGRFTQHLLWLTGMSCLLVALARPQWGSEVTFVESGGVQLLVVLDLSQSMMVVDGPVSRLEQAKEVVETAVSTLTPQDEVGLLVFAAETQLWLPLTSVHSQLDIMLARAHPNQLAQQGTLLAQAIEAGRRAFPNPHGGQAVMLILTDGEDHGIDLQQAVQMAANEAVILIPVGLGSGEGGPVPLPDNQPGTKFDAHGQPVISKPDEAGLQRAAEVGNGRYLHAPTAANQLPAVLNDIRTQHTGLERAVNPVERYQLFLPAAVLLFGLAAGVIFWEERRSRSSRAKWALFLVCFMAIGLLTACRTPDGPALIAEGNAAFAQEAYEQALKAYVQAGEIGEETAVTQYNLANTYYRMAQYSDAAAEFQTITPDGDSEMGINTFFNLGNAYFQQAQYEAAIAAYQMVLRQTPGDLDAKHNLELALQQVLPEAGASPVPFEQESGAEADADGVSPEGLLGDGEGGGSETAVSLQVAQDIISGAIESANTLLFEQDQESNNRSTISHVKDW